jgi:hypothetical protein
MSLTKKEFMKRSLFTALLMLFTISAFTQAQTATLFPYEKRESTHAYDQIFAGDWLECHAKVILNKSKVTLTEGGISKTYTLGKTVDLDDSDEDDVVSVAWYTLDNTNKKLGSFMITVNKETEKMWLTFVSHNAEKSVTYSCYYRTGMEELQKYIQ